MTRHTPRTIPALLALAARMATGAQMLQAAIGLRHNTQEAILLDRTNLQEALQRHQEAKTLLGQRIATATQAIATCRAWIKLARDISKPRFGTVYTRAWDVTGLEGSLMIPRSPDRLILILECFAALLGNHSELTNEPLQITPQHAQELLTNLRNATKAVVAQKLRVADLFADRQTKMKQMRKRVRCLANELDQFLAPDDPRRLSFGFALKITEKPAVPAEIEVTRLNATTHTVKWEPAPRAWHYRIWKRSGDPAQPFQAVGRAYDPRYLLEVTPGEEFDLAISAVNERGESHRSEPLTVRNSSS